MAANSVVRRKVEEVQAQAKAEREWWDEKRATIKTEFLKELDGGLETKKSALASDRPGSEDDAVLVEAGRPESSGRGTTKKKKGKK
jgi:translocation protein SEC66